MARKNNVKKATGIFKVTFQHFMKLSEESRKITKSGESTYFSSWNRQ
jgi:hypothetical protein